VTYGIDSTAKLWRATTPVDINVDDSDLGRFRYAQKSKYKKSIVVDEWKKARKGKEVDLEDEDLCFLPDETSEDDNVSYGLHISFTWHITCSSNNLYHLYPYLHRTILIIS